MATSFYDFRYRFFLPISSSVPFFMNIASISVVLAHCPKRVCELPFLPKSTFGLHAFRLSCSVISPISLLQVSILACHGYCQCCLACGNDTEAHLWTYGRTVGEGFILLSNVIRGYVLRSLKSCDRWKLVSKA